MKTYTVSTRLAPEELISLDNLAAHAGLDRASMTKSILRRGLKECRLEAALDAYAAGEVSLSRAAELAAVGTWDLLREIAQRGLTVNYDLPELEEDFAHMLNEG
jgi:predicted HTH domain antitoxin